MKPKPQTPAMMVEGNTVFTRSILVGALEKQLGTIKRLELKLDHANELVKQLKISVSEHPTDQLEISSSEDAV